MYTHGEIGIKETIIIIKEWTLVAPKDAYFVI